MSNSLFGLLGVVFVTLKITGFIDWSWWYVTIPFWGGFALLLVELFIDLFTIVIFSLLKR